MGLIDAVDVLDGDEGHVVEAFAAALALLVIRVGDLEQVDVADLSHGLADIAVIEGDLVDALDLGAGGEAVRLRVLRIGTRLVDRAGAVVAFDHQRGLVVEHVEVADRLAAFSQRIEPAATGPGLARDIEFDDA
ncbi:hypothetical protein D9M70_543990 [compost metagenome]